MEALSLLAPLLLMTGGARAYPSAGVPGIECREVSAECVGSAQASAAETAKQVQAGQDMEHGQIVWTLTLLTSKQTSKKGKSPPMDPNRQYDIRMHAEAIATTDWFLIRYDDLKPLLDYFKVKTPEELTGKSFSSRERRADFALDLLKHQIASHGTYIPPSAEAIYERTAAALSRMEEPDFSDVDYRTIYDAFVAIFHEDGVDMNWLSRLNRRIMELSHWKVRIAEDNERSPAINSRDRNKRFLLTNMDGTETKTRRLIFRPSIRPVIVENQGS